MSQIIRHGWYSQKQAERWDRMRYMSGSPYPPSPVVWEGLNGEELVVTEVTSEKEKELLHFDDMVYMGPVVRFLRQV